MIAAHLLAAAAEGYAVVLILAVLTAVLWAAAAYAIDPAHPFTPATTIWLKRFLGVPHAPPPQTTPLPAYPTGRTPHHRHRLPTRAKTRHRTRPVQYLDCDLHTLLNQADWFRAPHGSSSSR